jgi:predicted dehydrogenase
MLAMEQLLIIGAGVIGRHHADALAVIPGGDRCALLVFDPNAEARAAFARDYPRAELFEDLGAAMARGGGPRDIAIVATPPAPRFQIMERCLQSGWHVLAEKPFTMDAEQARQAVAWAEASGRLLSCCDSRFLGQACIAKTRAIWDCGRLGSCYRLVWRHRQGRSRSGVEWQPESPWFLQKAKTAVVSSWTGRPMTLRPFMNYCVRQRCISRPPG